MIWKGAQMNMTELSMRRAFAYVLACAMMLCAVAGCAGYARAMADADLPADAAALHYDMQLELDADMRRLTERVSLTFTNDSADTWSEVYLRDFADSVLAEDDVRNGVGAAMDGDYTPPTAAPQGQHINGDSALTSVRQGGSELEFSVVEDDPSVICVTLAEPLAPGERVTLDMDYYADIPAGAYRLAQERLSGWVGASESDARTLELAQFYPMLAVYEAGEWICEPYIFDGECFYTRCADYDISISLPADYTLVASGREESAPRGDGTVDWTVDADMMRDVTLIISNELTRLSAQSRGVDINSYFIDYGTGREQGETSLEAACTAVDAFTDAYGEYPYDELDVVESNYEYGGMEAPGLVRISMLYAMMLDSDYEEDRVDYAGSLRSTVAHEVAHEWFYAVVGNDQYRDAWLDESFAAYSEQVYWRACGRDEADISALMAEYLNEHADAGDQAVDRAYDEFEDPELAAGGYTASVYRRGAAFLYELEQALGAQEFGEFMRGYYAQYKFSEADTAGFIAALEPYILDDAAAQELIRQYLSKAR